MLIFCDICLQYTDPCRHCINIADCFYVYRLISFLAFLAPPKIKDDVLVSIMSSYYEVAIKAVICLADEKL